MNEFQLIAAILKNLDERLFNIETETPTPTAKMEAARALLARLEKITPIGGIPK